MHKLVDVFVCVVFVAVGVFPLPFSSGRLKPALFWI